MENLNRLTAKELNEAIEKTINKFGDALEKLAEGEASNEKTVKKAINERKKDKEE